MLIYIVLYLFIVLAGHVRIGNTNQEDKKRNNNSAIIIAVLITLLFGLRHPSMGWDLQYGGAYGYLWSFKNISTMTLKEAFLTNWLNYEKGYVVFNKLISYLSHDEQFLLFCCAVLSIMPIGYLIKKCSRDSSFSYLVYLGLPCFLMPFSGLRQGIAIGLCCLNYVNIKEKNLKRFLILLLITCGFHYSAFVFALAYPLYHVKIDRKIRIASLIGLVIVYVLRYQLFSTLSLLFKSNAVAQDNGAFTLLFVFVLVYVFCFIFIDETDYESSGFLNIFFLACVCQCFGGIYSIALRVGYYFMPAIIIALPNAINYMKNRNNYLISKYLVGFIFIIYGLYAIRTSSWAEAYPYFFFWEAI